MHQITITVQSSLFRSVYLNYLLHNSLCMKFHVPTPPSNFIYLTRPMCMLFHQTLFTRLPIIFYLPAHLANSVYLINPSQFIILSIKLHILDWNSQQSISVYRNQDTVYFIKSYSTIILPITFAVVVQFNHNTFHIIVVRYHPKVCIFVNQTLLIHIHEPPAPRNIWFNLCLTVIVIKPTILVCPQVATTIDLTNLPFHIPHWSCVVFHPSFVRCI